MTTRQQYLREQLVAQEKIVARAQNAVHVSTQNVGRARAAGIEDEFWKQQLELAEASLLEQGTKFRRMVSAYESLLTPTRPPPVEPPPTRPPPTIPPSAGTVDPYALKAKLTAQPKANAFLEWGHALHWPSMSDTRFTVGQGLAILNTGGTGPGGIQAYKKPPILLERLELDGQSKVRWGLMSYGLNGVLRHIYTHHVKEEHSTYNKGCWDLLVDECFDEFIGSQKHQEVNRAWEMVNPMQIYDPNGTGLPSKLTIRNCGMMQVGLPTGARPGYNVWLSESQGIPWPVTPPELAGPAINRDVELVGNFMQSFGEPNYQASGGIAYSFGAIAVHGQGHVVDVDNVTDFDWPDRGVRQYWHNKSLTIHGGRMLDQWHGKKLKLDIRGVSGTHILVDNLDGDWEATILGGNWDETSYIFQEQQIAPFVKYQHDCKVKGKSFEFVIP